MSQSRSIKDFFKPVPPKQNPNVVDCEMYDGDLIVVAPAVDTEQSKRRKVWSAQSSKRLQSPSLRATASPTPTPLTGPPRSRGSTGNVTPISSRHATVSSAKHSTPKASEASPSPKTDKARDNEEADLESVAAVSSGVAVDSEMTSAPPASAALTNVNTSFGSLPRSSQSTASKRVISQGEEVVKGSDTDTDSDSSLEDVTSFFPKRPIQPKVVIAKQPIHPEVVITQRPAHPKVVITKRPSGDDSTSVRAREPKGAQKFTGTAKTAAKTYAFSLDRLVAQSRKDAALKVKVADAKARLKEQAASPVEPDAQRDSGMLASLIEGGRAENEGEARRVMEALARTDALETKEVWHFFEEQPSKPSIPFPHISMDGSSLEKIFNDPGRRERTLLSGAVPSWASRKDIPRELLIWMLDQVCLEKREGLVLAYSATLKNSSRNIGPILTPARLERMFELLGARAADLNMLSQVLPTKTLPNTTLRQINTNLRHVADLLSSLAAALSTDTQSLAINLLARSSFDDSVLVHVEIHTTIEDALSALITALPDSLAEEILHRIGKSLFTSITLPVLRYQLVASLPYSPYNNSRVHLFRWRLALAFALNSSRWLNEDITKPTITSRILYSLAMSPVYKIKSNTDYVVLGATLNLLDIAIDAGFSDFAFTKSKLKTEKDSSESSMARPRQPEIDPRAADFDANIDLIVKEIRSITAKVVDTGATHMHRTEVKSVAERMIQRLECAVRTREKVMRNHYDREPGDSEVMTRFIKLGDKKAVDGEGKEETDGEVREVRGADIDI